MTLRSLLRPLLPALAVAGCAGVRMEAPAADERLSCRGVVTAEGAPAAVRVAWTREAVDAARLGEWCESVGPLVVHSPPAAPVVPAPPAPGLDSVVVVSWNVHVGGGEVDRLVGDLRAGRLTGAPVRDFVLLLQEVHREDSARVPAKLPGRLAVPARITEDPPGGKPRVDVEETARGLGLHLFYAPSMRNGPPIPGLSEEDRGNAILSTFPLEDMAAAELPFEAQRRVAVSATVRGRTPRGAPWAMRLTSAHLDNRSRWSRFWQSLGGGRLRQARGLGEALAGDSVRVQVVGGDFNSFMGTREEAVLHMRALFPQSPPPVPEPTFIDYGAHLDYFFLRTPHQRASRSRRLGEPYGSDHYPLLMWVRVSPPPSS